MKLQVISPMPSTIAKTSTALRATGTQSHLKTVDAFTPSTQNQRQGLNFNQESLEVLQQMAERFPKAKDLIKELKTIYPEIPASVSKQIIAFSLFNPDSFSSEEEKEQFFQTSRQLSKIINEKVYQINVPLPKESFELTDEGIRQLLESHQALSPKYPDLVKASIDPLSLYLGLDIPRSTDAEQIAIASLTHLLDRLKEHKPN